MTRNLNELLNNEANEVFIVVGEFYKRPHLKKLIQVPVVKERLKVLLHAQQRMENIIHDFSLTQQITQLIFIRNISKIWNKKGPLEWSKGPFLLLDNWRY